MSKILRQNVGGVDFTMAGCALTGVCPTSAADYVKQITLSDGDVIEDGMMMVVTFANGNTAGNAPSAKTIYSSDQVNYYEDDQLTVPFTLAPAGCYEIEYTGTANAYTYTDYPVFQIGSVLGPVCDYRGHVTSGALWDAGDSVQCMLKEGKFLLLGGAGDSIEYFNSEAELDQAWADIPDDTYAATPEESAAVSGNQYPVNTVESGNMHSVTSNAVAGALSVGAMEVISLSSTETTIQKDGVLFISAPRGSTLISTGCELGITLNGFYFEYYFNAVENNNWGASAIIPVFAGDKITVTSTQSIIARIRYYNR